jgi:hypothetical protein
LETTAPTISHWKKRFLEERLAGLTAARHPGLKATERHSAKIIRLVIGNPLIMKEMAKHVPDAGSYAPVTVLVDERADGVHLLYDRMASLLAPYGNPAFLAPYGNNEALNVARVPCCSIRFNGMSGGGGTNIFPTSRSSSFGAQLEGSLEKPAMPQKPTGFSRGGGHDS